MWKHWPRPSYNMWGKSMHICIDYHFISNWNRDGGSRNALVQNPPSRNIAHKFLACAPNKVRSQISTGYFRFSKEGTRAEMLSVTTSRWYIFVVTRYGDPTRADFHTARRNSESQNRSLALCQPHFYRARRLGACSAALILLTDDGITTSDTARILQAKGSTESSAKQ